MRNLSAVPICVGVILLAGSLAAARPQTRPTTDRGPMEQLSATVTAVRGLVQVRDNEEQGWRAATVGLIVPVGAECRTGPRSSITLTVPPGQVIVLDRLGVVKILEAMGSQSKFTTNLGMQYGRVSYEVEAAGLEHEAVIRSPSNALAIRGSKGQVTDDGLGFSATLEQGSAELWNPYRHMSMGSGPQDNYGNSPVVVNDDDSSPADHSESWSNPYRLMSSLTGSEQSAITASSNTTSGGSGWLTPFRYDPSARWQPLGPTPPAVGVGTLSFDLSWSANRPSETGPLELDLLVTPPGGSTLVRPSTGTDAGRAEASIAPTFPLGNYGYGVRYVSANGNPAIFTILVLINGKQINPNFTDTVTPLDPTVNFAIDISNSTGTGAAATVQASKIAAQKAPAKRNARPAVQPPARPARTTGGKQQGQ